MSNIEKLYHKLCMTCVFHNLLSSPLFMNFASYVNEEKTDKKIKYLSAFISEIYKNGGSLTDLVKTLVFEDENVYVRARAKGTEVSSDIHASVKYELSVFERFASLTSRDFMEDMKIDYVSSFSSARCDLYSEYEKRLGEIKRYGYGIFANYPMFRMDRNGAILPIQSVDRASLDSFVGYERERELVIENTLAFIEGRSNLNVLLCGDAGTGKSSTVKAIVNHFYERGLRLIELRKDQLQFLPEIMGKISENPLKFIIFIDDLSFNKNDDSFSMLKAALEGSASVTANNSVIYATSNRRHIVRETFDEREGSDVHRNDTMQEKLSLSDRFGLVVLFQKPSKKLYLDIVHSLAEKNCINMDSNTLETKAEEFALRRGNRSPRCAEQFIKTLL